MRLHVLRGGVGAMLAATAAAVALSARLGAGQEPTAARGTLEGRVVDSVRGTPLDDVQLTLIRLGGEPSQVVARSTTRGEFSFDGLEDGQYRLVGERPGYLTAAYGARPRSRSGTPLTVSSHAKEALTFSLTPQGVVAGRVLTEGGRPLPAAAVQLLQRRFFMGEQRLVPAAPPATTNDLGEYRVAGLQTGRYYLMVGAGTVRLAANRVNPKARPRGVVPTYYASSTSADAALPLDVTAGAELLGTDVLLTTEEVYQVSGRLSSLDSTRPAEGTTLTFNRVEPSGVSMVAAQTATVSSANGRFQVDGLASGQYLVTARTLVPSLRLSFHSIAIGDADIEGLELLGDAGMEVPIKVQVEGADLREGGASEPLGSIRAELRPVSAPTVFLGMPPAVGPDAGRISGVAPGRYWFRVVAVPPSTYLKGATYGAQDILGRQFDLGGGPRVSIEVTIGRGGGTVSGSIVDGKGRPAPGAVLALVPYDEQYRGPLSRTSLADQTGTAVVRNVAPGDYFAVAVADADPNELESPDFARLLSARQTRVTVIDGAINTLRLSLSAYD